MLCKAAESNMEEIPGCLERLSLSLGLWSTEEECCDTVGQFLLLPGSLQGHQAAQFHPLLTLLAQN